MKVSAGVKLVLVGAVCLLFVAGCGGGGSSVPPVTALPSGVAVSPSNAIVPPVGVQKFGATVTPSGANQAVTWSVSCPAGANCGTIDASGNYTAPATLPNPDNVTVSAISVIFPVFGSASVNIVSNSKIELDPASVAVAPDPSGKFGKFAYVANSGSNNVSMYTIDATTGILQSIGTIAAGLTPNSVAVDPSGKFAYVANSDSGDISMYTIDATTGVLQSIGTIDSPSKDAGAMPDSVVVHPSGKFAYVVEFTQGDWDYVSSTVSIYSINATTGALTFTGSVATQDAGQVAVHPSGNFAYMATPWAISVYTVDAATGALTSIGSVATQDFGQIAVHPSGNFAYTVNAGYENVSMYSIDATTGLLQSIGTIATGLNPNSVAVDPSGKFAYVANGNSADVSIYSIDTATGDLISKGTIAGGSGPDSIVIDPSGKFAYVADINTNSISMYTIDSTTGALTLIGSRAR